MTQSNVWEINSVIDGFLYPEIEKNGEILLEEKWGSSLLAQWSPCKLKFLDDCGEKKGDFHFLLGHIPVISEKTCFLFDFKNSNVELLPAFDETGVKYYIINPCFCDSQILNERKSKVTYNADGKISWISEPVFFNKSEKLLFMIPRMPTKIYANDTFVNIVKENLLQGIDFIPRKIRGPSLFNKLLTRVYCFLTLSLLGLLVASCAGSRDDKTQGVTIANEKKTAVEKTLVQKEISQENAIVEQSSTDTTTRKNKERYHSDSLNTVDSIVTKISRKRKVKPAFIMVNIAPFNEESVIQVDLSQNYLTSFNMLLNNSDSHDPIVVDKKLTEFFRQMLKSENYDERDSLFAIPQYYHIAAAKLVEKDDESQKKILYGKTVEGYETFIARYSDEPDWDVYLAHLNLAYAYKKMGDYKNAAHMFEWIADTDTTQYGERPVNLESVLLRKDAAEYAKRMRKLACDVAPKNENNFENYVGYWQSTSNINMVFEVLSKDNLNFDIRSTGGEWNASVQKDRICDLGCLIVKGDSAYYDFYGLIIRFNRISQMKYKNIIARKDQEKMFNEKDHFFIDIRDGQKYKIVKIDGRIWMAQNLNYLTANSWCYDNKKTNCSKYGRLYDWNSAMNVCPTGWHLPSLNEFEDLWRVNNDNPTTHLRLTEGWKKKNGDNVLGFSALPSGCYSTYNGNFFQELGRGACFWSSTEYENEEGYAFQLGVNIDYAHLLGAPKTNGLSVRCIKDDDSEME